MQNMPRRERMMAMVRRHHTVTTSEVGLPSGCQRKFFVPLFPGGPDFETWRCRAPAGRDHMVTIDGVGPITCVRPRDPRFTHATVDVRMAGDQVRGHFGRGCGSTKRGRSHSGFSLGDSK